MKPMDQSILHAPEAGRHGDCFRAVMASLFELPIEQVPHFLRDGCDADTFNQRINDWLRPMNLGYLPVGKCDAQWLSAIGLRGWHHEAYGPTSRGTNHACAALDGAVVHDPYPSRAGLLEIEGAGVVLVLDPSKPVLLARVEEKAAT